MSEIWGMNKGNIDCLIVVFDIALEFLEALGVIEEYVNKCDFAIKEGKEKFLEWIKNRPKLELFLNEEKEVLDGEKNTND